MRVFEVREYGEPRTALVPGERPVPAPGPAQVRVDVEALALNHNDLDGIRGRYLTVRPGLPFVPGMEVVGRVGATGSGAEGWAGRRVCAIPTGAHGGFAESAVCDAVSLFPLPDDLPAEQAAAVFFPFHLAWLSLFTRGRLQAGETALVHAAAGGLGSACVQLAKDAGATVIATAGSAEKLAHCSALGADHVVNYREDDFVEAVQAVTAARGADLVVDAVGGEVTRASMRCVAFGGRIVSVGFSSGIEQEDEAGLTPRPLLFANASLVGVLMAYADDPVALRRVAPGTNLVPRSVGEDLHGEVLRRLSTGAVAVSIGGVTPFERLPEAFDGFVDRTLCGRAVVTL